MSITFIIALLYIVCGTPSKKLLILDLNNLLVARVYQPKLETEHAHAIPYTKYAQLLGQHYTWKRPGLDQFLDYCFEHYTVAVWSSAWQTNVDKIVNHIFTQNQRDQLLFTWSQNQCDKVERENDKPLFEKNLANVWRSYWRYNENNTIILDDSEQKMRNNPDKCCGITDKWTPWSNRCEQLSEVEQWLENRNYVE